MTALVKYDDYITQLRQGTHDGWLDGVDGDILKVTLSDTVPNVATHTALADAVEIAYTNSDWAAGGEDIVHTSSQTGGTITVVPTDVTITASGAVAQFSYVVLRNSTTDNLIGYYPIGSAVNLTNGQSFTTDFAATLCTVS